MKLEYLIEIQFIRLTLKTSVSPNLKLTFLQQRGQQQPQAVLGCVHQLQCRRLQRKFDLSSLDPFKVHLSSENMDQQKFWLQLSDEGSNHKLVQTIEVSLSSIVSSFEKENKSNLNIDHVGALINLEFQVTIKRQQKQQKKEKIELNIFNPSGEKQMKQSSRSRRPPELNIQTKNKLRASTISFEENQKAKSARVEKRQSKEEKESKEETSSKMKQNQSWEIFSAIPEALSAFMRRKSKKEKEEPQFQQVKELLMSHHPTSEHHHEESHKLSIKLRVVIGLLVMGFFFLVVDIFKDKSHKGKEKINIKKKVDKQKRKGDQNKKVKRRNRH